MNNKIKALITGLFILVSPQSHSATLPKHVTVNGVEFLHVPAGEFWYAIPDGKIKKNNHMPFTYRDVKIWQDGFYIAKYETKASDFMRFMTASTRPASIDSLYNEGATEGCSVQRDDVGKLFLLRPSEDLPVTHLSWELTQEMAQWFGFRLPTEAEWVKAARGTDKRIWPWGNEHPDDTYAGYNSGAPCHPTPVDAYPNGASPYGAFGMAGGVYEYVADWYNVEYYQSLKDGDRNPYSATALIARSETSGEMNPLKILKGGRWASGAKGITVHNRTTNEVDMTFRCYGARFAIDEDQVINRLADGSAQILSYE